MTKFVTLSIDRLNQVIGALNSYCNTGEIDCADDLVAELLAERDQKQGEQEPVSWIENFGGSVAYGPIQEAARKLPKGVRFDLYTNPQPKLDPLTDEQDEVAFEEFWYEHTMETFPKDYDMSRFSRWGQKYKPYARKAWFARASIGRAHSIK